ncbi:MAG: biosynthetic arginine decarboxylase [Deltaproteobacteria bacterium]|nr:biosynthetic arginine decarboxylase [Deltaproteobacteria bacterium]
MRQTLAELHRGWYVTVLRRAPNQGDNVTVDARVAPLPHGHQPAWSVEDSTQLYMVDRWGADYFHINSDGNLCVAPLLDKGARISIIDVVREAREHELGAPVLIRFQDLLRHRVEALNSAFNRAIEESHYSGIYRGVFPIKVNQLREVVEEILDAGRPFHHGLEVGSKPEMFAALAVHSDNDSLIVCNGYKDPLFIRMALIGRKLGKKVVLVAEKLSEVRAIVEIASEMKVAPLIGFRLRLLSKGSGKWALSGGEHAKFGLSTSDLLDAVEVLREAGMEGALRLLHFHIGSQIPDILKIKRAVREATRYYAKLRQMGHPIEYLDVGGGLAIDYDGSRSAFHSSTNYTVQEYASDVVYNVMDVCDAEGVPHPTLVSESGRAVVAHHSVLVVEAFGAVEKTLHQGPRLDLAPRPDDHKLVKELHWIQDHLGSRNLTESFHDLLQFKEEAQALFGLGHLGLVDKARFETLFWHIAEEIEAMTRGMKYVPEEIRALENQLADQHMCNFSVFQSLLDHWALGQLFPIMPIHRLDERPDSNSTVVDVTCDSDGKVSKFIDLKDVKDTLPLHSFDGSPYYLGIFLTGAYQDIMGDIHNLFGKVNEVHVFLDEDEESGYYLEETIAGDSIADVLRLTQWDLNDLIKKVKVQVDAAIKEDRIKPSDGMRLLGEYERGLRDQTYLSLG